MTVRAVHNERRLSSGAMASAARVLSCCAIGAIEAWAWGQPADLPQANTMTATAGVPGRGADTMEWAGGAQSSESAFRSATSLDQTSAALAAGPDLQVSALFDVARFGSSGGITAYGVGSVACNIGDARIDWVAYTNEHPVYFANLYRLKEGRFEQIGMSWVTHGFYAVSQSYCGTCDDPTDGTQLGVNCSTPESANMSGVQEILGPRSEVNAHRGSFPYPWSAPPFGPVVGRRLQVHDADLDLTLNADAAYFVEVQYVTSDDAAAGNDDNSASFRRVDVIEISPGNYDLLPNPAWPTAVGEPGIRAWEDSDPAVFETDIRVPDEGLLILAAKATDLGTGFWHYEYALQNLNSHRSARSFSICFTRGPEVKNVGFHDVDYHSGEVYDSTDWIAKVAKGGVNWSTQSYAANANANALRFGTIYNFRFDANAPPWGASAVTGLFRPGDHAPFWARTIGPPDECPNPLDADHDGESDCFDFCADTPRGTCTCQGIGWCCIGCLGPCFLESRDTCVGTGDTPDECGDPQCNNGCPLLDMDNDGDRDLMDVAGLQRCFTGLPGDPGYVPPSLECLNRLDVDDDHAINLGDYNSLFVLGLLGR